ncbi:MAG: tRNA (adenosine(37)-N6)-threonylcarbamoyltransferase complex dimerization subunit type 1 TsaB [Bacteroidota bacterium]
MSLILNIDTATDQASVSLAQNGNVLAERLNSKPLDHAAWIHVAVKELMDSYNKYEIKDLDAVAVVAGPGSYTGIRVGMATAKGLCYALKLPLICVNTLQVMAHATNKALSSSLLLCPMLDARRMEVFTALYDASLQELVEPCAMILDKDSFSEWLRNSEIVFFGSGSNKWKDLVQHPNAIFKAFVYSPASIAAISNDTFIQQNFSGLAYSEPIYLKDFYSARKE